MPKRWLADSTCGRRNPFTETTNGVKCGVCVWMTRMNESKRIRILSVEDHPVFREGLATIISSQSDMELTAQASNAIEAIAEFRKHRPDITLMDLRLPGSSGTDALVAIRGEFPQARSRHPNVIRQRCRTAESDAIGRSRLRVEDDTKE